MRPGRVLSNAIPESADKVRQTVTPVAVAAHGQFASDRTIVLRPVGGQDAHRDAHQGHAVERQQFQLAVHKLHVTLRLEADDRDACLVVKKPRAPVALVPHRRRHRHRVVAVVLYTSL